MPVAHLDRKSRMKVLCGHCHRQLARISQYPEDGVIDHTLLVEQRIREGRLPEDVSERLSYFESGWRRDKDGVWTLNRQSQQRLARARWQASGNARTLTTDATLAQKRLGDNSVMRHRRPNDRLGLWICPPLPAQARCPHCSTITTLDAAILDVSNPTADHLTGGGR
jgi:hypothetical protein